MKLLTNHEIAEIMDAHIVWLRFGKCGGKRADMSYDSIVGESFYCSYFNEANLAGTTLSECYFEHCDFASAVLEFAVIKKCKFKDCTFKNVSLNNARISETAFINCDFKDASMRSLNAEREVFNMCNLEHTYWNDACLMGSRFNSCEMTELYLDANATDAEFNACKGFRPRFCRGNFIRAAFKECEFSMPYFNGSIIKGTKYIGCNIPNFETDTETLITDETIFERCIMGHVDVDTLGNAKIIDCKEHNVFPPEIKEKVNELVSLCKKHGISVDDIKFPD